MQAGEPANISLAEAFANPRYQRVLSALAVVMVGTAFSGNTTIMSYNSRSMAFTFSMFSAVGGASQSKSSLSSHDSMC